MAYAPRCTIVCDGSSFHVTWRCHNRDWLLQENWAKQTYYGLLLKYKDRYGIVIHSYHLMENHPHLTGTLTTLKQFSDFFRVVNNLFARRVNNVLKRSGQVVMDRFKSPRIQDDKHMLTAMTYIDLNGVRCGRDTKPGQTKWSSYAYYAYGKPDPLITPAPSYMALGETAEERQRTYREMVMGLINRGEINISSTCFIGDPDWVTKQYEGLRNAIREVFERRKTHADEVAGVASPG